MRAPARCEQGDHGRRKDPMGPWTLAEHGECTFEKLSISLSFLFSFAFVSSPYRFGFETWLRERPCCGEVEVDDGGTGGAGNFGVDTGL